MQWNLEQLRQFVAAAEQGSISAAARHLRKAQSAVSSAIGLLEVDLGVTLFDRSSHRVVLTDVGTALLQEAREVLRQADALQERARAFADGADVRLTLVLDEALPYSVIRVVLRELSARFPDLELTLLDGTQGEVAAAIEQRRADIGFHFDRGRMADIFDQRHIGSVAQGIFVSPRHPLAARERLRKTDLAQYRQLVLQADGVEQALYSPKIWRSDNHYSIAEMVADNLGWAILPVNVAAYFDHAKNLVPLRCPALALPHLSVQMLWLSGRAPAAPSQWIAARFTELLRSSREAAGAEEGEEGDEGWHAAGAD